MGYVLSSDTFVDGILALRNINKSAICVTTDSFNLCLKEFTNFSYRTKDYKTKLSSQ